MFRSTFVFSYIFKMLSHKQVNRQSWQNLYGPKKNHFFFLTQQELVKWKRISGTLLGTVLHGRHLFPSYFWSSTMNAMMSCRLWSRAHTRAQRVCMCAGKPRSVISSTASLLPIETSHGKLEKKKRKKLWDLDGDNMTNKNGNAQRRVDTRPTENGRRIFIGFNWTKLVSIEILADGGHTYYAGDVWVCVCACVILRCGLCLLIARLCLWRVYNYSSRSFGTSNCGSWRKKKSYH